MPKKVSDMDNLVLDMNPRLFSNYSIEEILWLNPNKLGIYSNLKVEKLYKPFSVLTYIMLYVLGFSTLTAANDTLAEPVAHEAFAEEVNAGFFELGVLDDDIISEELMLFQELPMVISAARREQPINQSSVPISVITEEDIHLSGATNLYEILQFEPGIDMLQIDRNRYALGVRGLHEFFSDRTLTLIDGRNADSPVFGGSEFLRLPLFLEDIERVEVVRGPAGASWGAQAFNGVINIITKDPKDIHGSRVTSGINEFGDYNSHIRWADGTENWDWRLSLGYTEWESSDEAIGADIDLLFGRRASSRDFHRNTRFDGEAIYEITDSSNLSFGFGASFIEQGDFEILGSMMEDNSDLTTMRGYTRIDHTFDNESTGYLQWFGNYSETEWPGLQSNESLENDVEAQYNVTVNESHHLTVGGNVRSVRITTEQKSEEDIIFKNEPLNEGWAGLFVLDRWQAAERLVIETQIRGDYYSETHPDWSGRLTSLYSLDSEKLHVVRLSGARAFRAPLAALREIENNRIPLSLIDPPIPPDTFATRVIPPADLDNEHIVSLEAGYSGQVNNFTGVSINSYYQQLDDLIGFVTISQTDFGLPFPARELTLDNIDDADVFGIEFELSFNVEFGQLSLWYAYSDFKPELENQAVRAFLPAKNKVGVNGLLNLPWYLRLKIDYKYSGTTPNNPGTLTDAPDQFEASHRLDLALSKFLFQDRIEWMIGVSDLFDDTGFPVFGLNNQAAHETPGRIFFTRFSLNF